MMLRLKRKQEGIIGPRGYLRNILSFFVVVVRLFWFCYTFFFIHFSFVGSSSSTILGRSIEPRCGAGTWADAG